MDIRFQNASGGGWRGECALVACFEGQKPEECAPFLWKTASWVSIAPGLRDFSAKTFEMSLLYGHPDCEISRVCMLGLGEKDSFTFDMLRKAVAKAVQACRDKNIGTIIFSAEVAAGIAEVLKSTRAAVLKEVAVAALLGLYRCDGYRSKQKEALVDPRWFSFCFTEAQTPDLDHRKIREGEAEAKGVIFARNLSNAPGNYMTPSLLANEAVDLARTYRFSATVFDEKMIQEKGMGALWAVAKGSKEPPRFIVLEHCPAGKENDAPLIFVGKGITFDSGGISLKPSLNMHEMKGDMGGAAGVLGFFAALGEMPGAEDFPRVIGLVPAAENMPGGSATRPGDVVTTYSGKTVEILNTDAEGRLILCDALAYAQKEWSPKALVNIATLTGACVIALGDHASGLFTKDKQLRASLLDSAETVGDLMWPLPLWEEYDANLKSPIADIPNIGPREGGALYAALFLQRFIEKDTVWAHLDIAGAGYVVKTSETHPVSGGTGMGVRLFCELARKL